MKRPSSYLLILNRFTSLSGRLPYIKNIPQTETKAPPIEHEIVARGHVGHYPTSPAIHARNLVLTNK